MTWEHDHHVNSRSLLIDTKRKITDYLRHILKINHRSWPFQNPLWIHDWKRIEQAARHQKCLFLSLKTCESIFLPSYFSSCRYQQFQILIDFSLSRARTDIIQYLWLPIWKETLVLEIFKRIFAEPSRNYWGIISLVFHAVEKRISCKF